MKRIWLSLVRLYISTGMFFYFRRIQVHNAKNVPKNKPVLILSNHQNALLDALLIAVKCGRFSYFLTRAAVFKKTIAARVLKSLQMLPVYRIRDGWGNLANNNAIFETCANLLNQKACIVIFPEGNHNLNRTVRPLSKGFTRIVLHAFENYPKIDLELLPVGVNYRNAENCPDSTSIYFGKPILAKDLITGNKNEDIVNLKTKIQSEISKLTTHIPKENYSETLNKLNVLNVDFLNPKSVNKSISNNFKYEEPSIKNNKKSVHRFLKMLLVLVLIIPYIFWKGIIQPKIKDAEFTSTFRFAIAITLVPIWILLMFSLVVYNFGWLIGFYYVLSVLVLTTITIKL